MSNANNIYDTLRKLNISEKAILHVESIRNSEPARKVKSGGKSVSGFYSSKKMGVTIQFESHKLELAAIYEKEHDDNVIEYYDQPPSFPISYKSLDGSKKIGHRYTADFFVIEKDWIGWEEWKMDDDLIKLAKKNPNRYSVDENGNWRCIPAEEYAKQFGLSFRVRTSTEINWMYQRNISFLEDYLSDENPKISDSSKMIIKKIVACKPEISLKELLDEQIGYTADDIYILIATEELYADIYNYLIVDFDKFPIFLNRSTFEAYQNVKQASSTLLFKPTNVDISVGNTIYWDTEVWKILNIGENIISLFNESHPLIDIPKVVFEELIMKESITSCNQSTDKSLEEEYVKEIFKKANMEDLAKANRKYLIVRDILGGANYSEFSEPDRTIRHWIKKYKDAEKNYGNGYVGLLPSTRKQGNHNRKISKEVIELMSKYIEESYETVTQKNRRTVYNAFKIKCEELGYALITYKTFCNEIRKRPLHLQTKKRQGTKGAYKFERFYYDLELTTPRHGDRPFEICHIDHTELDIELVCSQTGENLGKPWVTYLVDAYSRRLLAFYLTFDDPSYRSCMMVIRECVRKHGRFPSCVVVDGGKDFHSVYFDTLIARYGAKKKVRPGGKPKFGSVCERLFGTTNTVFIHNLIGNTKIMKNVRQVTKEVNPKIHACWNLSELFQMLNKWCYEVYDTMPHSALGDSPRVTYLKRQEKTGARKNVYIKYDETFKMLTLPSTIKGTAKVKTGQGVKINYFYYWSNALLDPLIEETQVPIRYDPFNMAIAYAYVNGYWATLHSEYFSEMEGRTEKEMKTITSEIRRRKKLLQQKVELSSSIIVEFLKSAEENEVVQKQRLKDLETKQILDREYDSKQINNMDKPINEHESNKDLEKQEAEVVNNNSSYKDILNRMKEKNSFEIYKEL